MKQFAVLVVWWAGLVGGIWLAVMGLMATGLAKILPGFILFVLVIGFTWGFAALCAFVAASLLGVSDKPNGDVDTLPDRDW